MDGQLAAHSARQQPAIAVSQAKPAAASQPQPAAAAAAAAVAEPSCGHLGTHAGLLRYPATRQLPTRVEGSNSDGHGWVMAPLND